MPHARTLPRLLVVGALLAAASGILIRSGSAGADDPAPLLTVPKPLPATWTVAPGSYSAPLTAVAVNKVMTVDLTGVQISGTAGYLFALKPGGHLTVTGGSITGSMLGLVLDAVPDGSTASVDITGTTLTGVRSIVYAKTSGGAIDVSLTRVSATGLGDGVRAVANGLTVSSSTLVGGGVAPSGYPAGIHSLDDLAGNVAVPGSFVDVFDSTITGFVAPKRQGDSIIGETRVASADIERNVLGHNSDSGGIDSKIADVTFANNVVYSDGYRAVVSHYGLLRSSGNQIVQAAVPSVLSQAYQATGTIRASEDVVTLAKGALLAHASYQAAPLSGPTATYPRVGDIELSRITDPAGTPLVGPVRLSSTTDYPAVIVCS